MPLKHTLARLRGHIQPIHRMHYPGDHAQPGRTSPERRRVQSFKGLERGMFEGSEERRAEFQVQGEETEGDEGRVGEEDWELA
jgi:hypothetical protein